MRTPASSPAGRKLGCHSFHSYKKRLGSLKNTAFPELRRRAPAPWDQDTQTNPETRTQELLPWNRRFWNRGTVTIMLNSNFDKLLKSLDSHVSEGPRGTQSQSRLLPWNSPDSHSCEPKTFLSWFEKRKRESTTVEEIRTSSALKYHTPGSFRVQVHLQKGYFPDSGAP